jgi:hypothetical protein
MDYTIVKSESLAEFEEAVNDKLEEGWRPQGGLAVIYIGGNLWFFYQALTKVKQ